MHAGPPTRHLLVRLGTDWVALGAIQIVLLALAASTAATTTDALVGTLSIASSLAATVWLSRTRRLRLLIAGLISLLGTVDASIALLSETTSKAVLLNVGLPTVTSHADPVSGNALAALLLPAPLAALSIGLTRSRVAGRIAWCIVASVGFLVIVLAGSRSALLGLAIGMAVVTMLSTPRSSRVPMFRAIPAVGLVLWITGWILQTGEASVVNRLLLWKQLVVSGAIPSGLGYGGFAHAQASNPLVLTPTGAPLTAHNAILQTLLDFGLIGLLLVIAVVAVGLSSGIRILRTVNATADDRALAVIAISATAGMAVTSMFESILSTSIPLRGGGAVTVFSPIPFLAICAAAGLHRSKSEQMPPTSAR